MGRAKLSMNLIPKEKSRNSTYIKRRKGLKKKIQEFSILCGVDACMILYGPKQGDRPIDPEIWPNNEDQVHRIINRYHQTGNDDHGKRSLKICDYFIDQTKKMEDEVVKLRSKNDQILWDDRVNYFSVDQLGDLVNVLGSKMESLDGTIALIKGQDHLLSGNQELIDYSFGVPNQNPYYTGGSNNTDNNDILKMEPLCYVAPVDHHRPIQTDYSSDHPNTFFEDAQDIIPANSFDYGNLGGWPIGNFSYSMGNNHPSLYDQNEYVNRGSSMYYMPQQQQQQQPMLASEPSIVQHGSSSRYTVGSLTGQMNFQPSIMHSSQMYHHNQGPMMHPHMMHLGPSSSSSPHQMNHPHRMNHPHHQHNHNHNQEQWNELFDETLPSMMGNNNKRDMS